MRGAPHEPFTPYWRAFQECCPTWPGFRSERSAPQLISELDRELDAEFDNIKVMHTEQSKTRSGNGCLSPCAP